MDVSSGNDNKLEVDDLIETIELTGNECRICLNKTTDLWQLFDNQHELSQKVMACTTVQVAQGDGLPTLICCVCRRLLDISYDFKCKAESTDAKLRQILEFRQSLSATAINTSIPEQVDHINPVPCAANGGNQKSDDELRINVTIGDSIIFTVSPDELKSMDSLKNNSETSNSNPKRSTDGEFHETDLVEKLEAFVGTQDDVIKVEESVIIESVDISDDESTGHVYQDDNYDSTELRASDATEKPSGELKTGNQERVCKAKENKSNDLIAEKCPVLDCNKTFGSKAALNAHLDQHKSKAHLMYTCYMCDKQFCSVVKLNDHISSAYHSSRELYAVATDDETSVKKNDGGGGDGSKDDDDIEQITDDQSAKGDKNVEGQLKYSCKYCRKQFTYEKAYVTHAKRHPQYNTDNQQIVESSDHVNSETKSNDSDDNDLPRDGFQCTLCGKLFANKRNLKRHISTHSGVKFVCPTCNKEFSRVDKLKEHEQLKHAVEFELSIDDDSDTDAKTKESESKDKDNNRVRKKKIYNRPYKCSMCPKSFAQSQSLTNHMERHKRVKDTQKRFLCEVCSKCFAQSGSLVAHMRTHTGVKPYVCNVCARAFTKSTYLQLHLRTHSGEKPYICQYCSRAFARANTLARHITMHTGEAKYHCQICRKSFRRLTSLNEHTYTHTGQRPYACKICTKRYNNAGSLYAHTKKCKAQHLNNANAAYGITNHQHHQATLPQGQITDHQSHQADHQNHQAIQNNDHDAQMIGYTVRKIEPEESMSPVITTAVTANNTFILSNIQSQKQPIVASNVIQQFTVDEANVYTVNAKSFKNSYYAIYPSM